MKQKQIFILLGGAGIVFVLFWIAVLMLVFTNLRGAFNKADEPAIINVTLCDEDAADLCVVTFGANNLNRMVIHFQLPRADYPAFYVKSINRDTVSVYTCEVDETVAEPEPEAATEVVTETVDGTATEVVTETMEATATEVATETVTETVTETATEPAPTSAHCTGVRTPLGETIDIEVYTTDGDQLVGRGTFLVSAIALSTPVILPSETPTEEIPTEEIPTEEFPTEGFPTEEFPTEEYPTEEIPTDVPFDQGEPTPDPSSIPNQ